jgi:hypothetical protein
VVYGFGVLATALRYRLHRWGLRRDRLFDPAGRRLTAAAGREPSVLSGGAAPR